MAKAKKAATKPKRGRPVGAKTRPKKMQTVTLSTCARCGSTDREDYHGTTERAIAGVDAATGKPYTHIVWRRTRCKNCGQHRIDRTFENRRLRRGQN